MTHDAPRRTIACLMVSLCALAALGGCDRRSPTTPSPETSGSSPTTGTMAPPSTLPPASAASQ